MIIGVAAGCIIMLHDYDDLRETERDISTPPSPSSSVISNIIPQPFDSKVVSTKYLVGFMYDTADFLEMAPSFECRYLYDGRVEARFWHDNPGSGRTLDIRYYELDEKQQKNVNDGIDLKKLYNLDPECENPEDVCDGGYSYIYIYDPEGEVFKACGGFCPTNKEFNKMLGVLHENLPDELVDDALNYKRQWQFYEQIASYGSIGIFTGYDGPLKDITGYSHIVIEAQNYSKEEIENYKGNYGRYVLGYLNVGSLEGFRDYYNDFADLSLGEYENWPGEVWVDVSDELQISLAHSRVQYAVPGGCNARDKVGLSCLREAEEADCRGRPGDAQHPVRLIPDAVELLYSSVSLILNLLYRAPGAVYPADGRRRLLADCLPRIPELTASAFCHTVLHI